MLEDLCFEDIKRQYLQLPLIPEDMKRYVEDTIALFNAGCISKEDARGNLEDVCKELDKLQHLTSSDTLGPIQIDECSEFTSSDFKYLLNRSSYPHGLIATDKDNSRAQFVDSSQV